MVTGSIDMKILDLTLSLLDGYELEGKYSNLALSSHSLDSLASEQKALVTLLFYTAIEHKITLDYYICAYAGRSLEQIDIHTLNILRLGLTELLYIDSIPDYAAVNECVSLGRNKGERGFINAILRSVIAGRDSHTLPMPKREKNLARFLSVTYSFPMWLCRHFIDLIGVEDTERLLDEFNKEGDTSLTVNTTRISVDELVARLCEDGYTVTKSKYSPISIRISGSVNPRVLYGFEEGYFFVQDESCAISASVLGAEPGEKVVDVCACPGGKSFAAASLMRASFRLSPRVPSGLVCAVSPYPCRMPQRQRRTCTTALTGLYVMSLARDLASLAKRRICAIVMRAELRSCPSSSTPSLQKVPNIFARVAHWSIPPVH